MHATKEDSSVKGILPIETEIFHLLLPDLLHLLLFILLLSNEIENWDCEVGL